jgi:UDP-N-acetylglucosamine--N-acetylmuramyl-(pentapeptide) pyrophosphoryl-undecaprenol N-acetylglucosamine transferase
MSLVKTQRPIMVMAGGTGGHVFPALAVAQELSERGEAVVWMGTRQGIEARLVPDAGIAIEWLRVSGIRGKGLLAILAAPFKIVQACAQAFSILRQHRPRAVLGMGGFAAGPGGLMAWLMRIPLVIHEQNAIIGLTNKLLSRLARINFFAFPQASMEIKRARVVGNPVRQSIVDIGTSKPEINSTSVNLLVVGGSLGARTLNQTMPMALKKIVEQYSVNIRHQSGPKNLTDCQQAYSQVGVDAQIDAFIDDMDEAYSWADLVVCRAGALTVAEISAAGRASILVPYPYAVDDHQFHNAGFLSDAGAAIRIRDAEFTADTVAEMLETLISHPEELTQMGRKARSIAYLDASQQVASGVQEVALS